jgi:hypothetical protein
MLASIFIVESSEVGTSLFDGKQDQTHTSKNSHFDAVKDILV